MTYGTTRDTLKIRVSVVRFPCSAGEPELFWTDMTVTIHLPSDIEAALLAQARAQGLDITQYVEHVLREQVPPRAGAVLSPAERAESGGNPRVAFHTSPPLSDEAISRESIYGDRG
jgi:hypothetical protein